MYTFGKTSAGNLAGVHPQLKFLLVEAIKVMNFSVTCGCRTNDDQTELFQAGKSQLKAGESKHNTRPSRAVDIAPYYPVDRIRWDDVQAMCMLYGIIKGIAHCHGIAIRWGGDWDSDNDRTDQTFEDVWHIELV